MALAQGLEWVQGLGWYVWLAFYSGQVPNRSGLWSEMSNDWYIADKRHIKQRKNNDKGAKFYFLLNGLAKPLDRVFRIL